ncbi:hypothetical protein Mtc_2426 [Methanocella conradii HZ254]|uniref:Uncharacterized protein n=2 Tax=Methanocella TaxID=570266 RepID=H8I6F7_METCZ|nr:hypothetical protein Mtc_2426 [Methanocella conradii HZ254]
MIFMANKMSTSKKVHIGGTIDRDVAEWLMKTRGEEKFSTHLNNILRSAMESGMQREITSLSQFKSAVEALRQRVMALQDRVESLEASVQVRPARKGRPKKARIVPEALGPEGYDVHADIDWYLAHDRYHKVKPEVIEKAFEMVSRAFDKGENVTVGALKEGYNAEEIGVPYPTFKLFYFPLIRDRMLMKGLIEKVEHAGKKGVYRKRQPAA